MKNVRQMLQAKSPEVHCVAPGDSVFDALSLMASKDVGALIVLEGERLAGIISERDYARRVILHGKASRDTKVSEIMTDRVTCIAPSATVEECMELMTDKRIRHLPVVENNRVVGVISIGDVVKEVISGQKFVIQQLEDYIKR
jgi:CBS domain-containing protein